MSLLHFIRLKKLKTSSLFFIFFICFQFLYTPVLLSNPYLENESTEGCKIDKQCIMDLRDYLDKQSNYSIYQVCNDDYQMLKNCCNGLSNCPSNFNVNKEFKAIKDRLSGFKDQIDCSVGNLSNYTNLIKDTQQEVCNLGSQNCKIKCENKLEEFKQRVKECFSISSIDEGLRQQGSCYKELKKLADRYKSMSLNKQSEFREDLSVQDIVNCGGVKSNPNLSVGTQKVLDMCSFANEEISDKKKAEEKKKADEEEQQRKKEKEPAKNKAMVIDSKKDDLKQEEELKSKDNKKATDSNSSTSQTGNKTTSGKCPLMPEISSQVVYQSVEAPQIEPLNEETDPYNNYDLVANKPAVVLLSIKPPENRDRKKENSNQINYKISLKVNNQTVTAKCSFRFNKIEIEKEDKNLNFSNRNCELKNRYFKKIKETVKTEKGYQKRGGDEDINNLNIFVKFPTKYNGSKRKITRNLSVVINSEDNKSCSSSTFEFSTTIRKTNSLHLNFINLTYNPLKISFLSSRFDLSKYPKKCLTKSGADIEVSDYNIVNKFAESNEVNEYLPMMYPIGEGQVSTEALSKDFILGTCDNSQYKDTDATRGIVSDVLTANIMAEWLYIHQLGTDIINQVPHSSKDGFSSLNRKLVVIVSKDYMNFHSSNLNGFILRPSIKDGEMIGNWNVAFVSEETLEDELAKGKDKAQGIVLHEVAHLLGQGKEYFKKQRKIGLNTYQDLPSYKQSKCQKFSNEPQIFCHDYKIFGSLMASFKNKSWSFINDKTPFMNNADTTIDNLGIDRETYQKLFKTLHDEKLDSTNSRNQPQTLPKPRTVVSLYGLYDKKKGKFYNSFSMIHKKAIPSVTQKPGNIEVSLIRKVKINSSIKSKVISKVSPIIDMELRVLLRNGGGKTIKLNHIPVVVNLPIPQSYVRNEKLRKDLRLIVREKFYTITQVKKKNPYMHKVGLKESSQTVSKKRRVLYNAPINWDAKPEDFLRRKIK